MKSRFRTFRDLLMNRNLICCSQNDSSLSFVKWDQISIHSFKSKSMIFEGRQNHVYPSFYLSLLLRLLGWSFSWEEKILRAYFLLPLYQEGREKGRWSKGFQLFCSSKWEEKTKRLASQRLSQALLDERISQVRRYSQHLPSLAQKLLGKPNLVGNWGLPDQINAARQILQAQRWIPSNFPQTVEEDISSSSLWTWFG